MEIKLDNSDNIISKTDLQGNISYVNARFTEISEYSETELLGKPHNILRHELMPKAVFELLWKRIKEGQELFAYVVNKTANNNFYWVLAHISPVVDETKNIIAFQSIRRRANPLALDTIKPLYKEMLELEKKGNTESSIAFLDSILAEENVSYDQFVSDLQTKR